MQGMSGWDPLEWGARLCRFVRYRGGFGVHSPYVFGLITQVIEERSPYYCYEDIELVRKQFLFREEPVGETGRQVVTCELVRRQGITPRQGQLLFRLANHLGAKRLLQVGAGAGLATLYLTAYAKELQCIVLARSAAQASVARSMFEKMKRPSIDLRTGDYTTLLSDVWQQMPEIDLLFFNAPEMGGAAHRAWFASCLRHCTGRTVIVVRGIRADRGMRTFWEEACRQEEVRVSIDLYSLGLLIFNPKLRKKSYKVYF